MDGFNPVGELKYGTDVFPVFKMDKCVIVVPSDGRLQFECPDFMVWRKTGSLCRYYMIRRHANERLLTILTNFSIKQHVATDF